VVDDPLVPLRRRFEGHGGLSQGGRPVSILPDTRFCKGK
jgi:hypothetical protein